MRERRVVYKLNETPRLLAVISVVLTLGMAWIWLTAALNPDTTGGPIPSPREGFLAPDFSLEGPDGEIVTLSELRGQVIVLNLWASWCPPCRAEMPALQQVYDNNRDRGLEVLAVNTTYQDNETEALAFVNELGLDIPILLERTGEMARQYQLRAMPSTFFIDREGVVRKVIFGGPMSEVTLQTVVEKLLGETP